MLNNLKKEIIRMEDLCEKKFPADGYPVRNLPVALLVNKSCAEEINDEVRKYRARLKLFLSKSQDAVNALVAGCEMSEEEYDAVYNGGEDFSVLRNKRIDDFVARLEKKAAEIIDAFYGKIRTMWVQDLTEPLYAVQAYDSASIMSPGIFWEMFEGQSDKINDQIIFVDFSEEDAKAYKKPESQQSLVLKHLISDGFHANGFHYVLFGASASHTRNKKMCFIREDVYSVSKDKMLAGLREYAESGLVKDGHAISSPGKWENYKMLIMSAVVAAYPIDWEKVLLVDEFTVELEDQEVLEIDVKDDERWTKKCRRKISLALDDGCFFLNALMGFKVGTYRGFYFKGFGLPIHFDRWVGKKIKCTDGKVRTIQADTPAIINTSVLKLYKAYDSDMTKYAANVPGFIWECKPDRDEDIEDHAFNYQMLQTILNTDEDDVQAVADLNANQIQALKQDVGARREYLCGRGKTYFQKLCAAYPPLRSTKMAEDQIQKKIDALTANAYKGKFSIEESYRFLMNDPVYIMNHYVGEDGAAIPADHFVSRGYAEGEVCDILRAPHMWPGEHCWRTAMADDALADVVPACNVIFMSCLDINTIILNNDVDGDIALALHENNPICKAAYNGKKLRPLVYDILKAPKMVCDEENTFDFYRRAYEHQKGVGGYANATTKILNNEALPMKDRLICAATGVQAGNNEIDSAKTQQHYEPEGMHAKLFNTCERKSKFPWFMTIAKGKDADKCCAKPTEFNPEATFINNCIVKFDQSVKQVYHNVEQTETFDCKVMMNADADKIDRTTGREFMCMYHWLRNISSKCPKFWLNAPAPELLGQFKLTGYDVMNEDVQTQRDLALNAFAEIRERLDVSLDEQVNYMVHNLMVEGCGANAGMLFILYGDVILKNVEANYETDGCVGSGHIWDATDNKLWESGKALARELGITYTVSTMFGMSADGKKKLAAGHAIYNLKNFAGKVDADKLANPTRELAEELNAILKAELAAR